jgi:hypothetical protein
MNTLGESHFVAEAIIARLRAGFAPTSEEASLFDRRPLADALRKKVSESDLPWVLEVTKSSDDVLAGFGCSLLRHHIERQSVKNHLQDRWQTASPYLKNRIMWRLLDDPSLSPAWHNTLRSFVFAHWDVFQEFNKSFYGPPETAIPSLLARLMDPTFPTSKKWVYLCSVPAVVRDLNAQKALFRIGLLFEDPLAREVAEQLLNAVALPDAADHTATLRVGR